jgi:hypothetical protein
MDIVDIVKNNKKIYMSESSLKTIMDFERVLDEIDLYAFKNWKKGELIEGPVRKKHWIEATFMWPRKLMPDPDGAKRLLSYNAIIEYSKDKLTTPIKVEGYEDFRPGTKKPKLQEDPVWLVKIKLPTELVEDTLQGFIELEGQEINLQDVEDAYNENIQDTTAMDTQQAALPGEESVPMAGPEV